MANTFSPGGSHSDFKTCYQHTGAVADGATITVPCANGLVGKYVRVRIEGTPGVGEILTLCDFKVNGQDIPGKICAIRFTLQQTICEWQHLKISSTLCPLV